jgi:hypothetical protein
MINHNGEFIAYRRGEAYFNISTCADETEIKCKVLEWLSRAAYKTAPFDSERENKKMWAFIQYGINKYLGTSFTADDFDEIYTYLGNRCNHAKTIRFIESGYDLNVLHEPPKEERE